MKKVLLGFLFSGVLLFSSMTTSVSASSDTLIPKNENLYEESNYVELVSTDTLPEGTPVVNFKNMDEFNLAVEDWEAYLETKDNVLSNSNPSFDLTQLLTTSLYTTKATVKNDTDTIKFPATSILEGIVKVHYPTRMWIDFSYTYTGSGSTKKFVAIKKVTSSSDGFPSSWYQTTHSSSIATNKRSVSIKILGYHLLGVNIGGQSIGAKFHDQYTQKFSF